MNGFAAVISIITVGPVMMLRRSDVSFFISVTFINMREAVKNQHHPLYLEKREKKNDDESGWCVFDVITLKMRNLYLEWVHCPDYCHGNAYIMMLV